MKITQDVRECAARKEIDEAAAFGVGMKEKAEEFLECFPSVTRELALQVLERSEQALPSPAA